jgi:shikimate kinase
VSRRRSGKTLGSPRAVILIGFMGAGKSSVGRALSAALGWAFEDLDNVIEGETGRTIQDIFRESGEAEFRRLEHAALEALLGNTSSRRKTVIALGGGAFVREPNASLIEAAKLPTVFLDADVEQLWERCERQARSEGTERPLMASRESFRSLYMQRRPHYMKALRRQETSGKNVEEIVAELIRALGLSRRSGSGGDKR